jgi:hypothetical protein
MITCDWKRGKSGEKMYRSRCNGLAFLWQGLSQRQQKNLLQKILKLKAGGTARRLII